MSLPFSLVDAFADRPFAGNPAAVFILPEWRDDAWMQLVAREMNQAETAFLVRNADGFDLRWFTPKVEVDLCGHATLASAHDLWERQVCDADVVRFSTRSSILTAARDGRDIVLDFPVKAEQPADPPADLLAALGTSARYVGRNQFDYLVEVESETALRDLNPDLNLIAKLPVRGVIVTCRGDGKPFDFVSRFFAPACGVPEDPVTGSAHCCLADYWHKRSGQTEFLARQASARGGVVRVTLKGDRVLLGGSAVTTARGELLADG